MAKAFGEFLNPEKALPEFDIKPGMKIADFGCGTGYFSIFLAKAVGENGRIYALDVLTTALESVQGRAKDEGLLNIETIRVNLEVSGGSKLGDESVDMVLVANILFQSSKKADIIKEAGRVLKRGGKMIVIDWKKDQPIGPPHELVFSEDLIKDLATKENFKLERGFEAGNHHWGSIFIKN